MDIQPIGQHASLIEAATQIPSTAMPGVNLTSPITPPVWMKEEKWYVLVMTALVRWLNLETTGVIPGDAVTPSPGRSAFQNPHMAAVFSGQVPARRAISDQITIVKELARSDAE